MSRTAFVASQLTRQSRSGVTTFGDVLTLTFSPAATTDYWLWWSLQADYNSTSRNCSFRLRDATGGSDLATPTNRTDVNANVFSVGGIAKWTSGASPGSQDFTIGHAPSNSADTVGSDEIFLIALKKESTDEYAESLTADSRTSSTLADRATLTFTPGSTGDYLILFSAEVGGVITASNNGCCRVLLDVNSTQYFDTVDGYQANTSSSRMAWSGGLVVNLAASSQTIKIRYASSNNVDTAFIRNTRILAIRLDSFDASSTDQDNTEQATSATTPQAAASVSPTVPAADHLVVTAGMIRYTTSARGQVTRTSVAGSARSANTRHQMSTAGTRKASYIGFGYDTLSAGTPTIETQWYAANAGDTARITDAFVGVLLPVNPVVDVVLSAGIGAAAGAGQAAVMIADLVLGAAMGSADGAGFGGGVTADHQGASGMGSAAAAGETATPVSDQVHAAGIGAAAGAGSPATATADHMGAPGIGAADAAGMTAQAVADAILAAGIGTAAASGMAATLTVNANVVLSAGVGAAIAEGFIAGLSLDAILLAAVGAAVADGSLAVVDASTIDEILAEISFALAIDSRSAFAPAVTGQVHMAASVDSRARVAGAVDADVRVRPALGSK